MSKGYRVRKGKSATIGNNAYLLPPIKTTRDEWNRIFGDATPLRRLNEPPKKDHFEPVETTREEE